MLSLISDNGRITRVLFREIKAEIMFEKEISVEKFPQFQDGTFASDFKLGLHGYLSLFTSRSACRAMTRPKQKVC